jgi:hypothetical protein
MPCPSYPVTPGFPLTLSLTTNDCRSPLRTNSAYCKRLLLAGFNLQYVNVSVVADPSVTVTVYDGDGAIIAQGTGQNVLLPGPATNYFLTLTANTYVLEVAGASADATGRFTVDLEPFWDDEDFHKGEYSLTPELLYGAVFACPSDSWPGGGARPHQVFWSVWHDIVMSISEAEIHPNESWIHIVPPVPPSDTVGRYTLFWNYYVDPNPSPCPREGTMAVGGLNALTFGVYQQGGLADTTEGAFVTTPPPMGTPRVVHTATLLPNGKVLVAGGFNGTAVLSTCEVYDPALLTWTNTGPLSGIRANHTATLLPNGKVLVAGGRDGVLVPLASAELYDPAGGTWASAGAFAGARCFHTATLLPNGKVLVAGGSSASTTLATSVLYNPTSGTWATTGPMHFPRCFHTATLLNSGKVLVTGGQDDNFFTQKSAELYDPAAGTWATTGSMTTNREQHTATLLANGNVLVASGYNENITNSPDDTVITAELYNPTSGTWSRTGSLHYSRNSHTADLLPDGKVLVVAGETTSEVVGVCEVFDPATGGWSLSDALCPARVYHRTTMLNSGQLLVTGGALDLSVQNVMAAAVIFNSIKLPATVTLNNLYQVYDGMPKAVYAVTSPSALSVRMTYNGSPDAPSNVGSYTVTGTINDLFYQGAATSTLVILPAAPTIISPRIIGGTFKLNFARIPGTNYNILASTNIALPLSNWTLAGQATETSPGQYEFNTSVVGTRRYFRVVGR